MYKNILFDLDGTLTDPYEGITKSVEYSLNRYGIEVDNRESLKPFIGPPLYDSYMKYYGFSKEEAERAVEIYRERFSVVGLFENTVYDGIPEMLSSLRGNGFTLAIASSKPTVFVNRILDHFDLLKYFDCVCGSELSGERVKKEDVVSYALNKGNFSANETIMVGDRIFDVEGAKKSNLFTVGVTYGYGTKEEMERSGADMLANSPADLQKKLLELK